MPNKKPSALFNSLFNFDNSACISMLSIANGIKYSFDFTLNDAPSTFSVTSFILVVLVNFEIMSSNWLVDFSLLITFNSKESLNGIFLFFLTVLIPDITSITKPNFKIISLSKSSSVGYFSMINASSGVLLAIYCQISSVRNGINGCKTFKLFSKILITALKV